MAGDCRCGARGFGSSTFVLAKRFGCRRRRTARGRARLQRGTPRSERGLARTCASIIERTSVGSRTATAKSRDRWRVQVGRRESGNRFGHSSNEGTPGRDVFVLVDERADTTALASRTPALPANREATGSVRGVRSSTVHAVENAAARGAPPGAVPGHRRYGEGVSGEPEARWASSSAHRPGAAHPQGCTALAARLLASKTKTRARGVGRWRRKPHARESDVLRVHGFEVGCRSRYEASRRGRGHAPKGYGPNDR